MESEMPLGNLPKIRTHPSGYGNTSKCYGALGCLNITEDWFGLARPVNLLPLDREVINTQFILRTRDSYGVSLKCTIN